MKPTRSKTPARTPKQLIKSAKSNSGSLVKDPVHVFCRLRPLPDETDVSCMKIISPTAVVLSPPETAVNYRLANYKEIQYTFKHVFTPDDDQNEVFTTVAQPLIQSLIRGRNGLLFTYGVTGSGKTFTMTGDQQNRGILPRVVDVLFKTIANYQAKKYIFKSDKLNGFDVQNEADACLDRQAELSNKFAKTPRRNNSDLDLAAPSVELSKVEGIDEDNMYAVFITYIEIYNNQVFDLLDEGHLKGELKVIRTDAVNNMYVNGVTEIECKSVEDAFEVFYKGLRRKRMAHTKLNAESSRSHSVFTIRLVQAPTDNLGENVIQDKKVVCISQLSLVDLAGSERTNRTKNSGARLKEASSINNSLMCLRTCLEILRDNQLNGLNKIPPYRESKMTHLFKNYFDGEGHVRMIVCVNPRADDYDETTQVMKFAELSQEIQVSRGTNLKFDAGLTPGRRKANQIFKQAISNLDAMGKPDSKRLELDLGLVYCLPQFPSLELNTEQADHVIRQLMQTLDMRIQKRSLLMKDIVTKQEQFRNRIIDIERESAVGRIETNALKELLNQERNKRSLQESKLADLENACDLINRRLNEAEEANRELQQEISEKNLMLNQNVLEKEKQKRKYNDRIISETEKITKEHEMRMKKQKQLLKTHLRNKDEKIRKVTEILQSDFFGQARTGTPSSLVSAISDSDLATPRVATATNTECHTPYSTSRRYSDKHIIVFRQRNDTASQIGCRSKPSIPSKIPTFAYNYKGVAVANPRHRRSRSAGTEVWLEHRAKAPVPLGTVLQPLMRNRKSVTQLVDVKDVVNQKTSKYCLISQDQDSAGEIETKLYKGDVIPSCSGGAQVIFNDVETLKQSSPNSSPPQRKRTNSQVLHNIENIESRCSIAIEGNKRARK